MIFYHNLFKSTTVNSLLKHKYSLSFSLSLSLTSARPSTDTGPPFLYGNSDTPPHLVAFYDHAGDTEDTLST